MTGNGKFPWKTTILSLMVIVLALIGAAVFLKVAKETRVSLSELAGKFASGHITTTFLEDIPIISSTHGNVLELATSRSTETFRREDALNSFWNSVYIGTTTAEIRVPVTFRYHLLLSDPWHLAVKGSVCFVSAPQFRPSLPPAIDTTFMEKRAESGWARFDKNQQLDQLEKEMTGMLNRRAKDAAHLDLVREQCRRSVAEFVKNWLIQRAQWSNNFDAIVVAFPDEQPFANDETLLNYPGKPVIHTDP
jgi:hypothetical protein